MFRRSRAYDFVRREFKYKIRRQDRASPDLYVKDGLDGVFVEVKLNEAALELRQGFDGKVERDIDFVVKSLYQLYSRIREIAAGRAADQLVIDLDRTYAILLLHEKAYTIREDYYNKCFAVHLDLSDHDREFIRKRIAIMSLYEIENFCYRGCSVLPSLKERARNPTGWQDIMVDMDWLEGRDLNLPIDESLMPIAREIPDRLFYQIHPN